MIRERPMESFTNVEAHKLSHQYGTQHEEFVKPMNEKIDWSMYLFQIWVILAEYMNLFHIIFIGIKLIKHSY